MFYYIKIWNANLSLYTFAEAEPVEEQHCDLYMSAEEGDGKVEEGETVTGGEDDGYTALIDEMMKEHELDEAAPGQKMDPGNNVTQIN